MTWDSFEWLESRPEVAWAVPIQMGDNHRGYPVIGTDAAYFERFRHSGGQPLSLDAGTFFTGDGADAAVVGAEVAARFDYAPGAVIVNAHGSGEVSFNLHDDAPFTILAVCTDRYRSRPYGLLTLEASILCMRKKMRRWPTTWPRCPPTVMVRMTLTVTPGITMDTMTMMT